MRQRWTERRWLIAGLVGWLQCLSWSAFGQEAGTPAAAVEPDLQGPMSDEDFATASELGTVPLPDGEELSFHLHRILTTGQVAPTLLVSVLRPYVQALQTCVPPEPAEALRYVMAGACAQEGCEANVVHPETESPDGACLSSVVIGALSTFYRSDQVDFEFRLALSLQVHAGAPTAGAPHE